MEQVNNNYQAPETDAEITPAPVPGTDKKKKIITIAAAAALAVIIAIVAIIIINYNSPKSVAERWTEAYAGGSSIKDYYKLSAWDEKEALIYDYRCDSEEDFFEAVSFIRDADITSFSQYYKAQNEELKENLEDKYGDDYTIEIEAKNVRDTSTSKTLSDSGIDFIGNIYEIEEEDVAACKRVIVRVKIKGEYNRSAGEYDVYLAKIKGAWKVLGDTYAEGDKIWSMESAW